MLKGIVRHSPKLVSFLLSLQLALYKPQMRHVTRVVDALIVCERRKTLSDLYRQYVAELDPKAAADCFRESPWEAAAIRGPRCRFMLGHMLEFARQFGFEPVIEVGVDDSLGEKDKATRHLDLVDFQHNHNESSRQRQVYTNGFVYVEVHVKIGPFDFTFDIRPYLREKTVRKLNRQRRPDQRLPYRSKYALAREMLLALSQELPAGYQVYVLFDAWYASAKLIKFCRRHGWHVICAIKSNRRLNGKRVDHHDQALRHKHYQPIRLSAVDNSHPPSYYVRIIHGHLEGVRDQVYVIISRRHPGDKRPKYFMCTDLSLSAQEALRHYQRRWPVEVDNFYLKEALGLGDFRLHTFEASDKWFAVVLLALNYLQFQQAQQYAPSRPHPTLADIIRQHRLDHSQGLLRAVAEQVLQTGDSEAVLRRFITRDGPVVT
jgi:hypothetical protein